MQPIRNDLLHLKTYSRMRSILFLFFLLIYQKHCAQISEETKLLPMDRSVDDLFGMSVSIFGECVLVGSLKKEAAYFFCRNASGEWTQTQKLTASDGALGDKFGISVSLSDQYAIVGSHKNEIVNGNLLKECGAVYVFKKNSRGIWEQIQKLTLADKKRLDRFGNSVAISNDLLMIGADGRKNFLGAVYIFKRNNAGLWILQQEVAPPGNSVKYFASYISMSNNDALVGAYVDSYDENEQNYIRSVGSAYFLRKDKNGIWNIVQKVVPENRREGDNFGRGVSINGNDAMVGVTDPYIAPLRSGLCYVFQREDGSGKWVRKQILEPDDRSIYDFFGGSVSIHDGYAVVSAHLDGMEDERGLPTAEGAIYFYKKQPSGNWEKVKKIISPDRTSGDRFGLHVSISDNLFVAGAIGEETDVSGSDFKEQAGAAYVWEYFREDFPDEKEAPALQECANAVKYVIPNVITPNGDNFNDSFFITDLQEQTSMRVIDRWGGEVFKDIDYKNDWSGENLPSGVYYYFIKQKAEGCYHEWKGSLHILGK